MINYEQDVKIDGEALDIEWLAQPSLMMKYCQISAKAQMQMDAAKEMVDVVRSGLDKSIRENPEKYGIAKLTESVVLSTVIVQEQYTEAYGAYLKAKYEADMAKGAVRAIEHRKDALENLVRLFGQSYFAGPKMPRELNREWEQHELQKRSNAGVAAAMSRKRRDE